MPANSRLDLIRRLRVKGQLQFPPSEVLLIFTVQTGGNSKQDINERKFPWHLFLPEDSPWCSPPEGRNKNWLLPANSFSTRLKSDYFDAFQWRLVQFNMVILLEPLQLSY